MSAWEELPIAEGDLPVTVRLTGVRVRAWQGVPDITVDNADQIEILDGPPWEENIDFATHSVEVDFDELAEGGGRVGVSTKGIIVSIRDDSGLIQRCPECRRVLRDGVCQDHGAQDGQEDVRLRLVMQGEASTISVSVSYTHLTLPTSNGV